MKTGIATIPSALLLLVGVFQMSFVSCAQQNSPQLLALEAKETDSLLLMKGLNYEVLFSEGDLVKTQDGKVAQSKGLHDLVVYMSENNSSKKGTLLVSHETASRNDVLGHGGGATVFSVEQKGKWKAVGDKANVDFSTIGYTLRNCGGKITPTGTILMAEESFPESNAGLVGQIISNVLGTPDTLYENFGWMVEVDPVSKKAIRKLTGMGRYVHEDALCLSDNKTVILTNDDSPAVLFKFVADVAKDYSKGKLYAYAEHGEHWIALPVDMASLKNAKQVAIEKGATLFVRHEWITQVGDDLYITETGHDLIQWEAAMESGGKPASYLEKLKTGENTYSDLYGRVLKLNTNTWDISVAVEGGLFDGGKSCFSNPDCINQFTYNGKKYLIISEDIIGLWGGRVSSSAMQSGDAYCEVYLLDVSIENATARDLIRFATAPKGCETTGLYFTPDEKTLFMAIQHPHSSNKKPFNKTCVIAITGF